MSLGLKIIASYILGSFIFGLLPIIASIALGLSFSLVIRAIVILFIILTFYFLFWSLKARRKISFKFILKTHFDPLSICLISSYLFYTIKTVSVLFLSPILSGDALYLWIPVGKVIYVTDRIPFFDIYHLYRFTEGPILPSYYAIYFVFKNDIYAEGFWTLPLIFMLAFPFIIYELTNRYASRDAAKIATILFTALPGNDFLMYFYAYYPDLFSLFFGLSGMIFTGEAFFDKDNTRKINVVIGSLSFALAFLTRPYIGLIILSITLISAIILLDYLTLPIRSAIAILFVIFAAYVSYNYNLSINPYYVLILSGLSIMSVVTIKKKLNMKISSNLLMTIILSALFSAPWIIRNVFMAGKLSPIPLTSADGSEKVFDFNIYQAQQLLNPLISPWVNSYMIGLWLYILIGLGLIRYPPSNNWGEEYLRTALFFSYIISSIIMYNIQTGRHGYFFGIFLCIALATFLQKKTPQENLIFLTTFYLFSYLNYPTLYFLEQTDKLLHNLFSLITIPYRGNYPFTFFIPTYFSIILIISFAIFCMLVYRLFVTSSRMFKRKLFLIKLLAVFILAIALNPTIFLTYAHNSINGNLMNFRDYADWYKGDRIIANELMEIINPNQRVITYADVMLSYYLVKKIDLYQSFSILKEYCPINEDLSGCLKQKLNVTYALIPTQRHYAYSYFLSFMEKHPQFSNIFLNECIKVKDYYHWTLCVLK